MGDFLKLYFKLIASMVLVFLVWCVGTPLVISYNVTAISLIMVVVDCLLPMVLTWYFFDRISNFIMKYK